MGSTYKIQGQPQYLNSTLLRAILSGFDSLPGHITVFLVLRRKHVALMSLPSFGGDIKRVISNFVAFACGY